MNAHEARRLLDVLIDNDARFERFLAAVDYPARSPELDKSFADFQQQRNVTAIRDAACKLLDAYHGHRVCVAVGLQITKFIFSGIEHVPPIPQRQELERRRAVTVIQWLLDFLRERGIALPVPRDDIMRALQRYGINKDVESKMFLRNVEEQFKNCGGTMLVQYHDGHSDFTASADAELPRVPLPGQAPPPTPPEVDAQRSEEGVAIKIHPETWKDWGEKVGFLNAIFAKGEKGIAQDDLKEIIQTEPSNHLRDLRHSPNPVKKQIADRIDSLKKNGKYFLY